MKKVLFNINLISLLIITALLFEKCDKEKTDDIAFNFPSIENIDKHVYDKIKKTCVTYWDLKSMIDTTFEIISNGDELSVNCDGIIDGQLYHFVIRTDSAGKWINDGRSIVKTSGDFLDITHMLNYNHFENIKTFILSNGDKETFCNMYSNNPHFSFTGFEAYLNPEIGQLNINCDPELSDFNEIVIRDQASDPQYFYLIIVRNGDLENEHIIRKSSGMIEGKIYLMKYYEYNLDKMAEKVRMYIDEMKDTVE
jgi:hypothetical protein